jgi:uncharacterized protein involved in exopolysaccharide biosynthesis
MNPLDQVGDVLEKAASYIEALEKENQQLKEAKQQEVSQAHEAEAQKLAEQYARATGADIDVATVKKIAASDDADVKALFNKLASFEEADELGDVHSTTKTANTSDLAPEDRRFLKWANS